VDVKYRKKVHVMFCKRMFGVGSSTNNAYAYCELGRPLLIVSRKIRIFKYYLKYIDKILLQSCYKMLDYDDALKG